MTLITGEAIDRVITIEAKNRAMPHGVLQPMYDAARQLAGNQPIAMHAAQELLKAVKERSKVLVLTGAGYPPSMPQGESDGPPGAAAIAKIIYKGLRAIPVYVCEDMHKDPIIASSVASGLMVRPLKHAEDHGLGAVCMTAPLSQDEVQAWATKMLDDLKPSAVISTERLGPAKDGVVYNATAQAFSGPEAPHTGLVDISALVVEASKRGILTIGIGDHGNEIGFGAIGEAVAKTMPKGERLATVVPTDIVLPVSMSNWGCYGIEAALAFLLKRPDLMHTSREEERVIRACLDAGGLEAAHCTTDFIVDGLDGETSMAVVQILNNIVRKNLEPPTTGLAH